MIAPKIRVLICENSQDFVWLLVKVLSSYPEIEIVGVAYDGNQAIGMIEQTKPDVLLLDIIIPDMDGLAVLRRLNELKTTLKVFVLSAIGNKKLIEMAMELGAKQYFVKPACIDNIVSSIMENCKQLAHRNLSLAEPRI
jgi:two-component system response regulator (stage 0 sporulation protein A)